MSTTSCVQTNITAMSTACIQNTCDSTVYHAHTIQISGMSTWCIQIFITAMSAMGWLQSAGSRKLQVSFAGYSVVSRALLQKRPILESILLTEATSFPMYTIRILQQDLPHVHKYTSQQIHIAAKSTSCILYTCHGNLCMCVCVFIDSCMCMTTSCILYTCHSNTCNSSLYYLTCANMHGSNVYQIYTRAYPRNVDLMYTIHKSS